MFPFFEIHIGLGILLTYVLGQPVLIKKTNNFLWQPMLILQNRISVYVILPTDDGDYFLVEETPK